MNNVVPRDTVLIYRDRERALEMWREVPHVRLMREDTFSEVGWNRRTGRCSDIAIQEGCSDATKELAEKICGVVQTNVLTSQAKGHEWTVNLLRNLPYLCDVPSIMGGELNASVPAFIVGSGPSLEKNRHLMAEAGARGLVIAVNAATHLVSHNLQICSESNDLRHKLAQTSGALCCYGLQCMPEVMQHATRLSPIWAGEIGIIPELMTGIHRLDVCGSATVTAIDLARRLGCSPIVLVGQDLALTDGRVYAGSEASVSRDGDVLSYDWSQHASTAYRSRPLPEQDHAIQTLAWGGSGMVVTTMAMQGIRRFIEHHKLPGDTNATEGGARIDGWIEATLADVVASLPVRKQPIRIISSSPLPRDLVRSWIEELKRDIDQDPEQSLLLDGYLSPWTIKMFEQWKNDGRPEHADRIAQNLDEFVAQGRAELGALMDNLLSRIAGAGPC